MKDSLDLWMEIKKGKEYHLQKAIECGCHYMDNEDIFSKDLCHYHSKILEENFTMKRIDIKKIVEKTYYEKKMVEAKKIRFDMIDNILLYQTTENYTFDDLVKLPTNELLRIFSSVG